MALCALFATALAADRLALAQGVPTPGSVAESFGALRPTRPTTPAQVLIPRQIDAPLHDRHGKRFQVHSFRFVGASAFTPQRLKRVVDRFVDLELNLYDLGRAADAVTEFYHDLGYPLARAFVPAQKVEDGVVTLAVVEGRVGVVLFSGNDRYASDWLARHTSELTPGELVANRDLERQLLLLNDLPGLKARATLSPGARFGTSDVIVKVEESLLGGSLTLDNSGREETGQWRLDAAGDINNPFGIGDRLRLRANRTEQNLTRFASIAYSLPIDADGARLSASYSDVRYDLAGDFAALGIAGSARTADLTFSWPRVRSRGHNETWLLSARRTELRQQLLGAAGPWANVPLANLAWQADWIDRDAAVTTLLLQAASNGKRNRDGLSQHAVRLKLQADATYLLPLDRYWDVYLRGAALYSPERLPDSEKYGIGGAGSVRGYRSSELRGDTGWQGTVEFRRRAYLPLGFTQLPLSVHVFGDLGRVTYKAPGYADSYEGINAWGLGMVAYLPTGTATQTLFKLEVAKAAGGYRASDGETTRLWTTLSTTF